MLRKLNCAVDDATMAEDWEDIADRGRGRGGRKEEYEKKVTAL